MWRDLNEIKKLEKSSFDVEYVNKCMEHEWGQRVIRLYDLDGHVIEVGEAMEYVARRFLEMGMTVEEVARKTQMAVEVVEGMKI